MFDCNTVKSACNMVMTGRNTSNAGCITGNQQNVIHDY